MTDIRTIIQQNLTRFSIIFYSKGIQVEESYDEGSCLVFGHQYDIHEICQNLIENVEIHSGANLLKVSLKIDNDKELIKMEILDNGIGFKEPLEFKVGLNVVQDKTKFCNGSFKIERITLNSESYTRATIILPLIKERLNIWIKE